MSEARDERKELTQPSGSVCGYCGTKGLRWKRFRGGYNMLTKSGRRAHRCKGYRKEKNEQIKF